jgi:putative holliday junction resolvase
MAGPRPVPPASSPPPASARPQSFLAFDPGLKRVGVASGNSLLGTATPLRTLAQVGDARFSAIQSLLREWQPDALVVGVPFHPDGTPHDNTLRAQRFARQLHGRFGLPVHQVDERYTTTEALAAGARDADAAAAALILEQFLRALVSSAPSGGPEGASLSRGDDVVNAAAHPTTPSTIEPGTPHAAT